MLLRDVVFKTIGWFGDDYHSLWLNCNDLLSQESSFEPQHWAFQRQNGQPRPKEWASSDKQTAQTKKMGFIRQTDNPNREDGLHQTNRQPKLREWASSDKQTAQTKGMGFIRLTDSPN
ncbi:hypothetical protein PoB_005216300 [Plakobranchus ocellatus]|uniref:Uncharacterized protein n=1 Tax=Plakobranchus ocellatus TaxID=259542 RepID=A0AAV4C193_9GAST|nr:hypothetical protein PoB_005216300 [Plakobranchus ocellatus]